MQWDVENEGGILGLGEGGGLTVVSVRLFFLIVLLSYLSIYFI